MGYSPARRASVTGGEAVRLQRQSADTWPARPGRRVEEHEQSSAHTVVGARGDDAADLWPTDTFPPRNDDKEIEAIRAFALVADRWQLTDQQAADLLGTDVDAWQTLRARAGSPADHNLLERRGPSRDLIDSDKHSSPLEESKMLNLHHTLHHIADSPPRQFTLSQDQLARISTFFYMYISLKRICAEGTADRWVTCENFSPVFDGRTPLEVMIEGGLPKIREARNYVSSAMW